MQVHVAEGGRELTPRGKKAPVALWVAGGAAALVAVVALLVPLGSSSAYGFEFSCPSAVDSLAGVARVTDISHTSQFARFAAKEITAACPQTAVAVGVGVTAALAGCVMLVVASVLTAKRARPNVTRRRGWVAPGAAPDPDVALQSVLSARQE